MRTFGARSGVTYDGDAMGVSGAVAFERIAASRRREARSATLTLLAARVGFVAAILAAWQLASGTLIDRFWVSRPSDIVERLVEWANSGFLWRHTEITLTTAVWGFGIGVVAAVAIGFFLGRNPALSSLVEPYIQAVYCIPKLALAPLFILWFGIQIEAKIAMAAYIVFFLVFWNAYSGAREVDQELIDVIRTMGGKSRDIYLKVVLPSAMAWVLTGIRVALPNGMAGAIVAEMIASNRGLGFLLQVSAEKFDSTGLFSVILVVGVIAAILNEGLGRLETHLLRWRHAGG
ncbi:MAG: ABC transporter permease [Chloroflexi bacterium]|nr:ABC transporter permease [Chloroflexota bacterium]